MICKMEASWPQTFLALRMAELRCSTPRLGSIGSLKYLAFGGECQLSMHEITSYYNIAYLYLYICTAPSIYM